MECCSEKKKAAVTQSPTCGDTWAEQGSAELPPASSHQPYAPSRPAPGAPQPSPDPSVRSSQVEINALQAERHSCVFAAAGSDPNPSPASLRKAGWVRVCRQESILGGDLQPFAMAEPSPHPGEASFQKELSL